MQSVNERVLGAVTAEESTRLKGIFDRKTALRAMLAAVADLPDLPKNDLYERVVKDFAQTEKMLGEWWAEVSAKYGWSFGASDSWTLNFADRTVTLHTAPKKTVGPSTA